MDSTDSTCSQRDGVTLHRDMRTHGRVPAVLYFSESSALDDCSRSSGNLALLTVVISVPQTGLFPELAG